MFQVPCSSAALLLAVPSTFPFPSRKRNTRLDQVLKSKVIKVAQQDLGPGLAAFTAAFKNITSSIAAEISAEYRVSISVVFQLYSSSDTAVAAVINGDADVTDPFHRQWTLVGAYPTQVLSNGQTVGFCRGFARRPTTALAAGRGYFLPWLCGATGRWASIM